MNDRKGLELKYHNVFQDVINTKRAQHQVNCASGTCKQTYQYLKFNILRIKGEICQVESVNNIKNPDFI